MPEPIDRVRRSQKGCRQMEMFLLSQLVEQAPLGIVVLTTDFRVSYMNRAARVLHNIGPGDAIETLYLSEIVAEPDSVLVPLRMVLEQDVEPLIVPYEVGPAAPRRFISASAGRVDCGPDGTWIILVAEDVTARKQLESELVETEKSSLLGQLVVTLQHQINNQLQVIVGQIDMALAGGGLNETVCANLAEVRLAAQRIGAHLRYLAKLDRVETVQYLDHVRMIDVDKDAV